MGPCDVSYKDLADTSIAVFNVLEFGCVFIIRYGTGTQELLCWILITELFSITFLCPCKESISVCSYNKSQRDALFLKFILIKNSTCIREIYCPSSGQIPVAVNTVLRLLMMDSVSVRNM
jgi:hypothetical protein